MSPNRLAMRTLMLGSTRSILAILLIAASLCVLDLFAGHVSSARARMEHQAVIGERMGHLAVMRVPPPGPITGAVPMFTPQQALQVIRLIEASPGVALVVPQMSVSGIASTGERSALFFGEGIVATPDNEAARQLPGKLNPGARNGVAVSTRQARSLGVNAGSSLTLTSANLGGRSVPIDAQVVDVYSGAARANSGRHPLLMPFSMAQTLLDTEQTERIVVYLSNPDEIEALRGALAARLRAAGVPVHIKTWQEQSAAYSNERGATDVAFDSVAGMVFAVIAATIAATISMNALERRREVGTLRALGMRSSAVFLMFVMEGLWTALTGVAVSLMASGLIAWIVNRVALSYTAQQTVNSAPMLVELDFDRMAMAIVTVLAVALLAALVPAFRAARGAIAPSLSAA